MSLRPGEFSSIFYPPAVKAGDGSNQAEPETVSRRVAALLEFGKSA